MKRFKKLTLKGFNQWVVSKKPDEVISKAFYTPCSCPVAQFIRATTGKSVSMPSNYSELFVVDNKEYAKPKWVNKFIPNMDEYNCGDDVVANDVLKVLNHFQKN